MTAQERLYDLLVRLSDRFRHPNDYVQITESWVTRSHGRIYTHNTTFGHGNKIIEDVTPEMWCCLDTYTKISQFKKPELDIIIRKLACDLMLETLEV